MPSRLLRSQATLVATRLRVERGRKVVLRDVSLTVGPHTRLGVIGSNGVGKTTLLRLLAGRALPDSGKVTLMPSEATVGYLAQEHERHERETVQQRLQRQTGVARAERELQQAAESLASGSIESTDRYSVALERFGALGVDTFEARTAGVLTDLGLAQDVLDLPSSVLSGGQAAKVALAAMLLSRFDLTLLDEPTNDLDFEGLERLERFVLSLPGGAVIVSHDRSFLEATVTSVLEIDDHDHSARLYEGGFASYLAERRAVRQHAEEAYATYDSERKALLERAQRERLWATSGASKERRAGHDGDKAQRDFRLNRTEKLAGRARMTQRALERLEPMTKPWEGWELRFAIAPSRRSGAVVLRLDRALISRGDFHLGPVDLEIGWAERVALSGPNGSGKTTLIAAMLGRIPLRSGNRYVGPGVVTGELGQDRRSLSGAEMLLDVFSRRTGTSVTESRSILAKFGLSASHVERSGETLSPGERTRAELAMFQVRGVNLLVLDEPTNHLDLPAIEQLEEALAAFEGTLVLVSHDRRLLDGIHLTRSIDLGQWRRGPTLL